MSNTTIARSGHEPKTRLEKGWLLYSEHASSIITSYNRGVWLVPSQSDGTSVYEVRLGHNGDGMCECLDNEFHPELRCKHQIAARYAAANSEHCAICGQRFPYGELSPIDGDYLLGMACRGCGV